MTINFLLFCILGWFQDMFFIIYVRQFSLYYFCICCSKLLCALIFGLLLFMQILKIACYYCTNDFRPCTIYYFPFEHCLHAWYLLRVVKTAFGLSVSNTGFAGVVCSLRLTLCRVLRFKIYCLLNVEDLISLNLHLICVWAIKWDVFVYNIIYGSVFHAIYTLTPSEACMFV